MSLLVTGVAGFIGTNFVRYYLEEYPDQAVIGLDNLTYAGNHENVLDLPQGYKGRFTFIKGDITDSNQVRAIFDTNLITGVINFAAESHVDRSIHDPDIFLRTNILGTHTLLKAAKDAWCHEGKWKDGVRFLQISTDEVYGSLGPSGFFSETTPLDPHSPYSASKAGSDLIVKAYFDTYMMPVLITRCSNNYGPYQFPEKLIPLTITRALAHQPIPVYGDGCQIRDWLYVSDHCQAINSVFKRGNPGSVYNIGGKNEQKNIDIVELIIRILYEVVGDPNINSSLIRYVTDRPGHDRRYAIDSSLIQKELGWRPSVSFDEGIRNTITWYLSHPVWLTHIMSGEYQTFFEKQYGIPDRASGS